MNWSGDIYREESGDYRVDTEYSYLGSFSILRFKGKTICYAKDAEEAKQKAEIHLREAT